MVFLHCTENERRSVVTLPYIYRFLTNKAGNPNKFGRPVAIIPDRQMYQLKFMLGNSNSPVEFVDRMYTKGDKVRVIRGDFCGLEGEVITSQDGKVSYGSDLTFLDVPKYQLTLSTSSRSTIILLCMIDSEIAQLPHYSSIDFSNGHEISAYNHLLISLMQHYGLLDCRAASTAMSRQLLQQSKEWVKAIEGNIAVTHQSMSSLLR